MAPGSAVLQAAGEDLIESYTGNHAQLARFRDGSREPPIGNASAHATLDDLRIVSHLAPIVA
jgi:hypothetical protein